MLEVSEISNKNGKEDIWKTRIPQLPVHLSIISMYLRNIRKSRDVSERSNRLGSFPRALSRDAEAYRYYL
jgi:hypothetical protein